MGFSFQIAFHNCLSILPPLFEATTRNSEVFISPELFHKIKHKNIVQQCDAFISDMFSFGIVILKAATLN
jgi:hypothetical protein